MTSEDPKRIENVQKMEIPDLVIYRGDNDDVFQKYLNCFILESEYDGVLVLEDDVQLCWDFYTKVLGIIQKYASDVISFFEKPNSRQVLEKGFRPGRDFMFNQCNYYPKATCELFLGSENVAEFKNSYFTKYKVWVAPIDIYIAHVLSKYKLEYLMYLPFLVQHLPFKSILGNRSTKRQTKFFIDDL